MYKIYQIDFEDGSVYVGQTKQKYLSSRIYIHKKFNDVPETQKRLNSIGYKVSVLDEVNTKSKSLAAERKYIMRHKNNGADILNYYVDCPNKRVYIKKPDWHLPELHCYICDLYKPRTEFHICKNRHTGRKSRCKTCANIMRSFTKNYYPGIAEADLTDIVKDLSLSV